MRLIADIDFHGSPEFQYRKYLNSIETGVSNGVICREEANLIMLFVYEVNAHNQITNRPPRKLNI
jgi:hypothetical protein